MSRTKQVIGHKPPAGYPTMSNQKCKEKMEGSLSDLIEELWVLIGDHKRNVDVSNEPDEPFPYDDPLILEDINVTEGDLVLAPTHKATGSEGGAWDLGSDGAAASGKASVWGELSGTAMTSNSASALEGESASAFDVESASGGYGSVYPSTSGASVYGGASTSNASVYYGGPSKSGTSVCGEASGSGVSVFCGASTSGSSMFGEARASGSFVFGAASPSGPSVFGGPKSPGVSVFGGPKSPGDSVFSGAKASGASVFSGAEASGASVFCEASGAGASSVFNIASVSGPSVFGLASTVVEASAFDEAHAKGALVINTLITSDAASVPDYDDQVGIVSPKISNFNSLPSPIVEIVESDSD